MDYAIFPEAVRSEFEIPEKKDHKLLMMGYSAPEAKTSPFHFDKKTLSDIVVVL